MMRDIESDKNDMAEIRKALERIQKQEQDKEEIKKAVSLESSKVSQEESQEQEKEEAPLVVPRVVSIEDMLNILYQQQLQILEIVSQINKKK